MVFCSRCGASLSGQTRPDGDREYRYYRHPNSDARHRACLGVPRRSPDGKDEGYVGAQIVPGPKLAAVNANELEDAVMRDLFDTFGNAAAVQRAVEAATPNPGKVDELRLRRDAIRGELAKAAAKGRVVDAIAAGTLTDAEAKEKLAKLRDRESALADERQRLDAELEHLPEPEAVRATAERFAAAFRRGRDGINYTSPAMWAFKDTVNHDYAGMTWDDARALARMVFGAKTPGGERMGVYVGAVPGEENKRPKPLVYRLTGRVIAGCHPGGHVPRPDWYDGPPEDRQFRGGPHQRQLLKEAELLSKLPVLPGARWRCTPCPYAFPCP
jgi:hypothetical protein